MLSGWDGGSRCPPLPLPSPQPGSALAIGCSLPCRSGGWGCSLGRLHHPVRNKRQFAAQRLALLQSAPMADLTWSRPRSRNPPWLLPREAGSPTARLEAVGPRGQSGASARQARPGPSPVSPRRLQAVPSAPHPPAPGNSSSLADGSVESGLRSADGGCQKLRPTPPPGLHAGPAHPHDSLDQQAGRQQSRQLDDQPLCPGSEVRGHTLKVTGPEAQDPSSSADPPTAGQQVPPSPGPSDLPPLLKAQPSNGDPSLKVRGPRPPQPPTRFEAGWVWRSDLRQACRAASGRLSGALTWPECLVTPVVLLGTQATRSSHVCLPGCWAHGLSPLRNSRHSLVGLRAHLQNPLPLGQYSGICVLT